MQPKAVSTKGRFLSTWCLFGFQHPKAKLLRHKNVLSRTPLNLLPQLRPQKKSAPRRSVARGRSACSERRAGRGAPPAPGGLRASRPAAERSSCPAPTRPPKARETCWSGRRRSALAKWSWSVGGGVEQGGSLRWSTEPNWALAMFYCLLDSSFQKGKPKETLAMIETVSFEKPPGQAAPFQMECLPIRSSILPVGKPPQRNLTS